MLSSEVEDGASEFRRTLERIFNIRREADDTFKILEMRPQGPPQHLGQLPENLNTIQRFDEEEAANTRSFRLGSKNRINRKTMAIDRVDEVVLVGTKEIWEITNISGTHHPFHVHDVQFQILDRNGEPPPLHERGWKDTVDVRDDETVRIMIELKDYPDPHTPYMFHCHILEHEDHGMMGQFAIVADLTVIPEVRTEAHRMMIDHDV